MVLSRLVRSVLALGVVFSIASAQVWERVGLPGQFAQGYYLDVFFLPSNPQYGWACGFNGFVVRTTNGGQSWQAVVPFNGRAGGHLESVHFVDQFNGYVSGPAGVFVPLMVVQHGLTSHQTFPVKVRGDAIFCLRPLVLCWVAVALGHRISFAPPMGGRAGPCFRGINLPVA